MTEMRPVDRPVGWSGTWEKADAVARMRAERKKTRGRWLWMTLLPIAAGTGSGLYFHGRGGMDLTSGVIFGVFAAVLLQLWALAPLLKTHARAWEGTVVKLREVRLPRRGLFSGYKPVGHGGRDQMELKERYVTEYSVICKTDAGGRRALRFLDDPARYRYFKEGDRVRACPALGTFEKYDRTGDDLIFCPFCGAQNALGHPRCGDCDHPLVGED